VTVMTLFNHRFVPAYWQAKQRIASGELGTVRLAYARKNDTRFVPEQMIAWADQTTPAWFLSSHDIDLLLWYSGEPVVRVHAEAVRGVLDGVGINTPDAVQAQLVLANGAVATVEACWIYPNSFPTMTDSFMEVILSDGVIHLDRKKEQIEIASPAGYSFPRNQLAGTIAGRPAGSTATAVSHFVDCVLDGTQPLVDISTSVHVTQVLAAIEQSCATGSTIEIEEF
jgi:predicted dehydrogenase